MLSAVYKLLSIRPCHWFKARCKLPRDLNADYSVCTPSDLEVTGCLQLTYGLFD